MGNIIDLTGRRFGKLTVIGRGESRRIGKRMALKPYWICKCDCGNIKEICGDNLRSGISNSCGCEVRKSTIMRSTKHGFARRGRNRSRIYSIWHKMIERCDKPTNKEYRNYGGRGISVCDEWHDFETFKDWAYSNGYSNTLTIDRIDVNGNYEPSNCRWATWHMQANNTRRNVKVKIGDVTHTMREWCEILNLHYSTVNARRRRGIDALDAMFTPVFHSAKSERIGA